MILANPALIRMKGYDTLDELSASRLDNRGYMNSEDDAKFLQEIEDHGFVQGFTALWQRKDGGTMTVHESAHRVLDDEGNLLYYEGIAEDITAQYEVERALRSAVAGAS